MKILAGMTANFTAPGSEKLKKTLNSFIVRAMADMGKFVSDRLGADKCLLTGVSATEQYRGSSEILLWSDLPDSYRAYIRIMADLFSNSISCSAWISQGTSSIKRYEKRMGDTRIVSRQDIKAVLEAVLFDKKKWQDGKPASNLQEEIDTISMWVNAGIK